MNIRAVICDVYNTLLEVGPPRDDAPAVWERLWRTTFHSPVRLSLGEFGNLTSAIIKREHATAKATGIQYPEIFWPAVATEALSELASLTDAQRDDFLYWHAQLQHSLTLAPSAAEVVSGLARNKMFLGIASNAQPYTLRELDSALAGAGLDRSVFRPDLCFWSFEHGFSKPSAEAFRMLSARLLALGVAPQETLMVGDRLDNDIVPARAQGWQTWHLSRRQLPNSVAEGDWHALGLQLGVH